MLGLQAHQHSLLSIEQDYRHIPLVDCLRRINLAEKVRYALGASCFLSFCLATLVCRKGFTIAHYHQHSLGVLFPFPTYLKAVLSILKVLKCSEILWSKYLELYWYTIPSHFYWYIILFIRYNLLVIKNFHSLIFSSSVESMQKFIFLYVYDSVEQGVLLTDAGRHLTFRHHSIPSLYTWVLDLSDHIAFLALSHVLTVPSGLQGQCHSNSVVEHILGICFTDGSSSPNCTQCHSHFRTGKVRHRIWDSL